MKKIEKILTLNEIGSALAGPILRGEGLRPKDLKPANDESPNIILEPRIEFGKLDSIRVTIFVK